MIMIAEYSGHSPTDHRDWHGRVTRPSAGRPGRSGGSASPLRRLTVCQPDRPTVCLPLAAGLPARVPRALVLSEWPGKPARVPVTTVSGPWGRARPVT
jgi:hypothetical protein